MMVQYKDGDNGQTVNNSIRPYFQLQNQSDAAIGYKGITLRYWLTAENFNGINTWIDYAQLGNNKISARYISLPQPRDGAWGYVEYSFDETAGTLLSGANSGPVQTRLAGINWANQNETNDYSYASGSNYASNDHITLYRNGILVAGTEPATVPLLTKLTAFTQNNNYTATGNSISTFLKLSNDGNTPVNYKDLAVRYWFTADGVVTLNHWVDYAALGTGQVKGSFVTLSPSVTGADTYVEIKVDSAAGALYPGSSTGNIQYRITKSNWSAFNEADDYSWKQAAPFAENGHVTVYYQGQLIYGTEPADSSQLLTGGSKQTMNAVGQTDKSAVLPGQVVLFPNPTAGSLNIRIGKVEQGAQVQVYTLKGELLLKKRITGVNQTISLQGLAAGIYNVEVRDGNTVTTKLIVKN
jgi:hypothetical protein